MQSPCIRPHVCLAGPGAIPSTLYAAGAVALEEAMRLAAGQDRAARDASAVSHPLLLPGRQAGCPIFDLVAGVELPLDPTLETGRVAANPDAAVSAAALCAALLVREAVDILIVVGLADASTQAILAGWPAAVQTVEPVGGGLGELAVVHAQPSAAQYPAGRTFAALAASGYAQGLPLSMRHLFDGESCRRIGIPLYPFAGQSYWLRRGAA